ncbi:MAG: ABC transporter permease [Sphingobacteriaceae bacterium]
MLRYKKSIQPLNFPFYLAQRLSIKSKRTFSKLIVRMAIFGIMLGMAVMILSLAIVKGFKSEIREKVRSFAGDIQILKYDLNNSFENSPFTIQNQTFQDLKKDKNLAYIQPFASKPGIIKVNNEVEGVVLKGIDTQFHWDGLKPILVSGKPIDFTDTLASQKQIIISKYTADKLNLRVGDDFLMYFVQEPLRKRKFEIVGIYDLGVEEVDKTYVIGDINLIRRLNNWGPQAVGGYEIRVNDFNKLDGNTARIHDSLDIGLKAFTVKELYPVIFQWLSLLDVNTQVIFILMLVVALINMISALLIMILERTQFIGLMKALGSSNWNIRKIFLYQAAYLIGLGLILGNILGVGLAIIQEYTHFIPLDQESYYMTFVPIEIHVTDLLLLNGGTLLVCVLFLLIPSMLVSRISPVKALRFQ